LTLPKRKVENNAIDYQLIVPALGLEIDSSNLGRQVSIKNTPSEEILKIEQKIGDSVKNICQELQKTNHTLSQLTDQLKVSNDLNKQLVSWIAYRLPYPA